MRLVQVDEQGRCNWLRALSWPAFNLVYFPAAQHPGPIFVKYIHFLLLIFFSLSENLQLT